jgi:hypothetical protein
MKLIFSRKGFDSGSGGGPSPIVDGRPVSLPIPAGRGEVSRTRYRDIGLGAHVSDAEALCHHDPFFADGFAAFGQAGAAEGHLRNNGVGPGDLFLFFGLYAAPGEAPHHRLFGWMRVETRLDPRRDPPPTIAPDHPHVLNRDWTNNAIYVGPGGTARRAHDALRLTAPGASASIWHVPAWLAATRALSYHGRADRWLAGNRLRTVGRGQEFVADITGNHAARRWADTMIREMETA